MLAIELPIFSVFVAPSINPATENDSYPRDSGYQSVPYPIRSTAAAKPAISFGPPSLSVLYQAPSRPSSIVRLLSDHPGSAEPRNIRRAVPQFTKHLLGM